MGTATAGGVEFLDLAGPTDPAAGVPGGARGRTPADKRGDAPPGGRPRWWAVVLAGLVVGGLLVAARGLGAPPPAPPAPVVAAPVAAGQVALPAFFGTPVATATAAARDDDVVWVLGSGGQVARVVDGQVTAVTAARGYGAVAARPDGRGVFVTTGRFAPSVVGLDPVSLEPVSDVLAAAPVTALAVGVGSVWAASAAGGVQGWTTDLGRAMRTMRIPPEVTAVRSLAIVGARLQALVTTTPGTSALLRLEPPGGAPQLTSQFTGPVSLVPGVPALVGHVGAGDTVEVTADPAAPGAAPLGGPLDPAATLWPATRLGTARWVVTTRVGPTIDCFDASGQLVGRMAVGDRGQGIASGVVATSRAVYATTVRGELARGGHGSCGAAS